MQMIDADKLLQKIGEEPFFEKKNSEKIVIVGLISEMIKGKNIPKEAVEHTETIPKSYTCPECGASVTYKEDVQNPVFGGMNCTLKRDRCIYCGQMIKWGE